MLKKYLNKLLIEAGCDEAGRGCLAGPVYAAAVIFPKTFKHSLIKDSKKLNNKQRNALRTFKCDARLQMVKQVLPHARHIRLHFNTQRLQARALAYTREFEQLGRQNRPGAQHHFAAGACLAQLAIVYITHTDGARAFPQNTHRLRLR